MKDYEKMSFTDVIEKIRPILGYKSKRQLLLDIKQSQQNFNGWEKGSVPNDEPIFKIAEMAKIKPEILHAMAKKNDPRGTNETRDYWRRYAIREIKEHGMGILSTSKEQEVNSKIEKIKENTENEKIKQ